MSDNVNVSMAQFFLREFFKLDEDTGGALDFL